MAKTAPCQNDANSLLIHSNSLNFSTKVVGLELLCQASLECNPLSFPSQLFRVTNGKVSSLLKFLVSYGTCITCTGPCSKFTISSELHQTSFQVGTAVLFKVRFTLKQIPLTSIGLPKKRAYILCWYLQKKDRKSHTEVIIKGKSRCWNEVN